MLKYYILYVAPEGSTIYDDNTGTNGIEIFEDKLLEVVTKYPDSSLLIAGYLNARCGEIQDISESDNVDFIFDDAVLYEKDDFNLVI